MSTVEQLKSLIVAKAEEINKLKADKAAKDIILAEVNALLGN